MSVDTVGTGELLATSPSRKQESLFDRVIGSYVLRRIVKAILTTWVVATLVFFLVRLLPGNPVDTYIQTLIAQQGLSYPAAAAQAAGLFAFNPTESVYRQYLGYMSSLLHGNLGNSILSPGTTVAAIIRTYLPWTLFSVGVGLILAFILGLLAGMLMAYRRGSWIDHVFSTVGAFLHAVPNYIWAILIVVFLGVKLQWFDLTTMRGTNSPGINPSFSLSFLNDALYHASLPILVYVMTQVGTWALVMKSSTVEVLGEDYVTVAQARGLSDGRIVLGYVGRNAVLPLISQFAVSFGFVVGGSIFVEKIFGYQGIGAELFTALNARDYPLMQGIFLVVTISVIAANLVADLLYSRLDPRIRVAGSERE